MSDRRMDWRVWGALAGWVALQFALGNAELDRAMGWRTFFARGLREGIAGVVILGWVWGRKAWPTPRPRVLVALAMLALVNVWGALLWRPYVDGVLHVRYAKAAEQTMVLLAAPMWLALLGALRWVRDEVPRRTVGAVLVGIAGYCLLLREEEMSVRLAELPALSLTVAQVVALVAVWSLVRRAGMGRPVAEMAGWGLVVSGLVQGLAGVAVRVPEAQDFVWRDVWLPLGWATVPTIAAAVLWFYLLTRMQLAAFATQQMAGWVGGVLVSFVMFGFLSWRLDLALVLGVGALWVALRSRVEDEEPLRLGVTGPR